MTPKLSLITGTYNRPSQCERLIASVLKHTTTPFELIISDASDVPLRVEADERVRLLEERPRVGHCKGYNRAFRAAQGEWLLWLNDDAEVIAGYDVEAIAFMESHPNIGLGALHYSENGGAWHVNSSWNVLYANFGIFRKSLGEQVGYFDEDIHMYGADNSLAFRVLLRGFGIADIPKARILHHSEADAVRAENQKTRLRDNGVLTKKYMPLRAMWTSAFNKHRNACSALAWSHGKSEKVLA